MEISISKEILKKALENQSENDFITFDCDVSCVENIGQLEIDELINDHYYEPDINDFVSLLSASEVSQNAISPFKKRFFCFGCALQHAVSLSLKMTISRHCEPIKSARQSSAKMPTPTR